MPTPSSSRTRRPDALSRDVVAAAAVELLDRHGVRGFTVKLLTERLRTGAGAVYWHVANKDELVALAADRVLGDALASVPGPDGDPEAQLREVALAVYDTLERHPWAASHVTALSPLGNALRLLERIGALVAATGLPAGRRFAVATTIFGYLTGATVQDAARSAAVTEPRDTVLGREADRWAALDPADFPFLRAAAADLRDHDDRDQFATGLDLILGGLRGLRRD